MNPFPVARRRHLPGDERGQVLIVFAVSIVVLMGLTGFVIDWGRILYAKNVLQASSDAAAAAGAQQMNVAGHNAVSIATAYSGVAGRKNASGSLPGVKMSAGYPQLVCLSAAGLPECPVSGRNPASVAENAIRVRQQVDVHTVFARLLGIDAVTVAATATAAMKGGGPTPLDIVVVLDTTSSMAGGCSAAIAGASHPTKLDCAKAGVRALLGSLWPCDSTRPSCGAVDGSGNVPVNQMVDKVGLVIFPPLTSSAGIAKELDCSSNVGSDDVAYDDPVAKTVDPNYSYTIVHPASDYRTSAFSSLNASSNLVKALGFGSCGVEHAGAAGSAFAVAIEKAQAELNTYGRAGIQDVIIIVSDGEANYGPVYKDVQPALPEVSPYRTQPCHQAIASAHAAAAAGTWIYAIAYDSSGPCRGWSAADGFHVTSTGVPPPVQSPRTFANGEVPAILGSAAMAALASDSKKSYNQPGASDLTTIFRRIATDLTMTRLVSDDTQ